MTHRVWQEQMRQGSRHRVPRTRGQRPPQGENMATAPETPKLGRGAYRTEGEVPTNMKQRALQPPRIASIQAGTPGFHRKQLLAATQHLQLLLRKEKKIKRVVGQRVWGVRSYLKGLRLPCWAQGPYPPCGDGGMWALLSPLRLGVLGA